MLKSRIIRLVLAVVIVTVVLFIRKTTDSKSKTIPDLSGPYLGQTSPGPEPQLFAPDIVTTGLYTRDLAMTPDGNEIYFCVVMGNYDYATIMVTKQVDGHWTEPRVTPYMGNPEHMNLEPCISPDGQKFYFLSNRPNDDQSETEGNSDIWVMDREGDKWGEPYNLGSPINTEQGEFFPSITSNGTFYFTRALKGQQANHIYRSRLVNGKYSEPEKLPPQVNSGSSQFNAYVAPDESFLIVPVYGREDSQGSTDYYICFRNADDTWNEPINLGDKINTTGGLEYSPYISPDGEYFFFMSTRMREKAIFTQKNLTLSDIQAIDMEP